MKFNKLDDEHTQEKRVTFEISENRLFAITRDLCKYEMESSDHDTIDFEPYGDDYITEEEKTEIREMLEEGKFEDYLEWD